MKCCVNSWDRLALGDRRLVLRPLDWSGAASSLRSSVADAIPIEAVSM
jgi:hypothetical protein